MKVIYIAGPYRSKSEYGVYENIHVAGLYAIQVWKLGGVAICPHKNTAFFGGVDEIPDSAWLDGDLEILSRCDAVYVTYNWIESSGARAEVEFAKAHNIPVLYSPEELQIFLSEP
jgi:hypothetical protein